MRALAAILLILATIGCVDRQPKHHPFIVIGVLFYLLMIRPERRKRAAMSTMLDHLKKNDRIVTIGGIYGVVVNVQQGSDDVTIRVDEGSNTRLRVLRSAISRIVTDEDAEKKDS